METKTATEDNTIIGYSLLRFALKNYSRTPSDLTAEQMKVVKIQAWREFEIEKKVLNSKEAQQVEVSDSAIDKSLETIRSRYGNEQAFVQDLEDNHLSLETLRMAITRELRVEAILQLVSERAASISELDARIFYYMHPEKFSHEELRTVRHILITINPEFSENTETVARQTLGSILRKVKKKPVRFADMAMKHSECPTALNGGLLGELKPGVLYPELEAELATMKQGDISGPIQSPMGLHLLYCEKITPAGLVKPSVAVPKIMKKLTQRRQKVCQHAWLQKQLAR